MGLSHKKKLRRHVDFYQTAFGFYEPFKVLCRSDLQSVLSLLDSGGWKLSASSRASKVGISGMGRVVEYFSRQGDVLELIQSSFIKRLKLYTTPCVLNELRSLGAEFSAAVQAAEDLNLHKCGHRDCISAADCLISCVGDTNSDHWSEMLGVKNCPVRVL